MMYNEEIFQEKIFNQLFFFQLKKCIFFKFLNKNSISQYQCEKCYYKFVKIRYLRSGNILAFRQCNVFFYDFLINKLFAEILRTFGPVWNIGFR